MSRRFRRPAGNSCPRMAGGALLALLIALVATVASAEGYPFTVQDALGRRVTLAGPPRRIISVAPSVTEILSALDLGGRIVGIGDADDYPPGVLRGKTRVGGVVLNVERILTLRPDLIIGVASLQQGQLERLIRLGLPVLAVEARSLEETFAQILLLGRVTGRADAAARTAAALRGRVSTVERRVAGRPRPRVYVEIWGEPMQTSAGGTYVDDLLRRGGGHNLFADLRGWPQVAPEAVVRRNPEVILLTYQGRRLVARRAGWGAVTAVRRGAIYELDPDVVTRPGPRLVDGLERIARLLHPEAFGTP